MAPERDREGERERERQSSREGDERPGVSGQPRAAFLERSTPTHTLLFQFQKSIWTIFERLNLGAFQDKRKLEDFVDKETVTTVYKKKRLRQSAEWPKESQIHLLFMGVVRNSYPYFSLASSRKN